MLRFDVISYHVGAEDRVGATQDPIISLLWLYFLYISRSKTPLICLLNLRGWDEFDNLESKYSSNSKFACYMVVGSLSKTWLLHVHATAPCSHVSIYIYLHSRIHIRRYTQIWIFYWLERKGDIRLNVIKDEKNALRPS